MPVLSPTSSPTASSPTWTNERIELLKQHFEAGLTCSEIAADIGVSRNAVIGKLSGSISRAAGRATSASSSGASRRGAGREPYRGCNMRCSPRSTATPTHLWSRVRSTMPTAARCWSSPRIAAAGRSRRRAQTTSASRQYRARRPVLLRRPQPPRLPAELARPCDARLKENPKTKNLRRGITGGFWRLSMKLRAVTFVIG